MRRPAATGAGRWRGCNHKAVAISGGRVCRCRGEFSWWIAAGQIIRITEGKGNGEIDREKGRSFAANGANLVLPEGRKEKFTGEEKSKKHLIGLGEMVAAGN